MDMNVLTALVVITTIIALIVEQISFRKFINRSNYEVEKVEFYCELITFKAEYDLLPNKQRLNAHRMIGCVINDIYELGNALSIDVDFSNLRFKKNNNSISESMKKALDLMDDLDNTDEDIKELFNYAIKIKEKMVKLYSEMFFFWTYYTSKFQVKCYIYALSLAVFILERIPSKKNKKDEIEKEYTLKDKRVIDSLMYSKFC